MREERDEVFVRLTIGRLVVMPLLMAALFTSLRAGWAPTWVAGAVYFAAWGWLTPPVILMLHCTMHRPFMQRFKRLDKLHPWVMTWLFGIPAGYREHHMGMHHAEDNMGDDLSSTLRYQRDSFLHFLAYFFRFFFLTLFTLPAYLFRKGRNKQGRRAVVGELLHMALIALALGLEWRFGLIAFLLPFVVCRFMMMAGNWGQHAFINTSRKNNGIANSITCINSGYNRRCFNDGYHIGHHMKASRHWSELPGDFLANREAYAKAGAIVFEGLDFFLVSFLLWTKQYRTLAKRFVRLDGAHRSDAEVIALLKERVKPVQAWEVEGMGATQVAA